MNMYLNENTRLVELKVAEVKTSEGKATVTGSYTEWDKTSKANVEKTVTVLYTDFAEEGKPKNATKIKNMNLKADDSIVTVICEKNGKFYGGKTNYASDKGSVKFKNNKGNEYQVVFGRVNKVVAANGHTNISIPIDVFDANGVKDAKWFNIAFFNSERFALADRAIKALATGTHAAVKINMGKDYQGRDGKTYTNYVGYEFEVINKNASSKTESQPAKPTSVTAETVAETTSEVGGIAVFDEFDESELEFIEL